jgi:hypothetical protein
MKFRDLLTLGVGLFLVAVFAKPMMDYGEERTAAAQRRGELGQLLQRLSIAQPPRGAAFAEQLRGSLGSSDPTETQLAEVREILAGLESAKQTTGISP